MSPEVVTERALVFASDSGEGGNEARVQVRRAGELTVTAMQDIARAQDAPVTVFVSRGEPYWAARFFTRNVELPYCGHGVLAAAYVALEVQGADRTTLDTRGGAVQVRRSGSVVSALSMQRAELEIEADPATVLAALGLHAEPGCPVHRASIGSLKWLVEVADLRELYSLQVDADALSRLSQARGVNGVYVFTRATENAALAAEARGFNPRTGALEDGATGVAAGALAWLLHQQDPAAEFRIRQGRALGKDNRITVRLGADGSTEVGGLVALAPRT